MTGRVVAPRVLPQPGETCRRLLRSAAAGVIRDLAGGMAFRLGEEEKEHKSDRCHCAACCGGRIARAGAEHPVTAGRTVRTKCRRHVPGLSDEGVAATEQLVRQAARSGPPGHGTLGSPKCGRYPCLEVKEFFA